MDVVDDPSAAVGPSLTSLGSHSSGGGVLPLVHAEHAAAAAAALIQEELLPRLFPAGVEAPLPQSSEAGSAGFSTTAATAATAAATTVQVQQSVVVLPSTSQWPLSSEHDTMVYRRPPSSEYVTVSEASSCGGSGCGSSCRRGSCGGSSNGRRFILLRFINGFNSNDWFGVSFLLLLD